MKKLLLIPGSLFIAIAAIVIWGYQSFIKPDQEIRQQLVAQFGEEFFNVTTVEPSNGDMAEGTAEEVGSSGASINISPSVSPPSDPFPGSANAGGDNSERPVTATDIKDKYIPQFKSLQNLAISRLDALYAEAVQEYKRQSEDGTVNRAELAKKYIQAGNMLETSINSQFYNTLQAMEAELTANHLPTDVITEIKAEYEKAKSDKRSQLLANALN